jgi:hypothetical protein
MSIWKNSYGMKRVECDNCGAIYPKTEDSIDDTDPTWNRRARDILSREERDE